MSDFIDGLEQDLVDAARRRANLARRATRPPLHSLALAAAILTLTVGSATAGTLVVLRGTPIPAPSPRDVPASQMPIVGSSRVAPVRAADPGGGPPWALRVAHSKTGFVCSTVGQVVGGEFGLVGLDGRFRRMAAGIVDGCGQERRNAATLVGARVFDAPHARDVRTIVNGVGGDGLRQVTIEAGGRRRRVKVGQGGVFIAALRGYPEDTGIQVTLRYADGHRERHPFGISQLVVPDPAGGRAWKVEGSSFGQPQPAHCAKPGARRRPDCRPDPDAPVELCVRFRPAREVRNPPFSEAVCGRMDARQRHGYFFGVRREVPGPAFVPGDFLGAGWKHHPPRTAVFGMAGRDVARVEVLGPDGRRALTITPGRAFLAVYGPRVLPDQLAVRVTMRDGRAHVHHGDTNLITPRRHP